MGRGGLREADRQEEGEKQERKEEARDTRQEMESELRLAAAVKKHTCRTADGGRALGTGGRGRSLLWQPTPTAVNGLSLSGFVPFPQLRFLVCRLFLHLYWRVKTHLVTHKWRLEVTLGISP